MSHTEQLDWSKLSWASFQRLGIYLANDRHHPLLFQEYGLPGASQDGIDLIAPNASTGKDFTIQVKLMPKITPTNLQEIVDKFRDGKFYKTSSEFRLLCIADLRSKKIEKKFIQLKAALKADGINFELWDLEWLYSNLKDRYRIVERYFGEYEAKTFCIFPKLERVINEAPVDFLDRTVRPWTNAVQYSIFKKDTNNNLRLFDFITTGDITAKRICLIGDPHQGKTQLLKDLAFKLERDFPGSICLILDAKTISADTIESQLDMVYSGWRDVAGESLFVIVDGVDEVASDHFIVAINKIQGFATQYRTVNVIFSCRSTFIYTHSVINYIKGFQVFELNPLGLEQVFQFIHQKLGKKSANRFLKKVEQLGLTADLINPLFLTALLDDFIDTGKVPTSRIAIIESIASRTIDLDTKTRMLRGNEPFIPYRETLKELTQAFAFDLQVAGVNSFMDTEIVKRFSRADIEMLRHSALIAVSQNGWQFKNAGSQEYLAALKLSKKSFEEIVSLISKGEAKRIIQTKWIQTVASLLSILPSGILFDQLVQFIAEDKVDFIFQAEPSKFNYEQQKVLLVRLLTNCADKYLRITDERRVARFLFGNADAVDVLIDFMDRPDIPVPTLYSCQKVLRDLNPTKEQGHKLRKVSEKLLTDTHNTGLAEGIMGMLATLELADEAIINLMIHKVELNHNHEFRDGIYRMIAATGSASVFFDFAIEGVPILFAHNKETMHVHSENGLEAVLINFGTKVNLEKLLAIIGTKEWSAFYNYHGERRKFYVAVSDSIAALEKIDNSIWDLIVKYLLDQRKTYLYRYHGELDKVLETTDIGIVVGRYFADSLNVEKGELPFIVLKRNIDFYLSLVEDGEVDYEKLNELITISGSRQGYGFSNDVTRQVADAGKIPDSSKGSTVATSDIWEMSAQQDLLNDLKAIASMESFQGALKKFWKVCKKEKIGWRHYDWMKKENLEKIWKHGSHFVQNFINSHPTPENLNNLLSWVDSVEKFEWLRVSWILDYSFFSEKNTKQLNGYLLDFFNKKFEEVSFENAVKIAIRPDGYTILLAPLFQVLSDIFLRVEMSKPFEDLLNLLWLDYNGYHEYSNDGSLNTIAEKLLSYNRKYDLQEKVLENLELGIDCKLVLETHIGLVQYLQIGDAKPYLEQIIRSHNYEDSTRRFAIEAYCRLEGDTSFLLGVLQGFSDPTSELVMLLVEKLRKVFPDKVSSLISSFMDHPDVTDQDKIHYAYMLADYGVEKGFLLLSQVLLKEELWDVYPMAHYDVTHVNLGFALSCLEDCGAILTKTYSSDGFDDPKKNLLDWLLRFAERSEVNLLQVIAFLERKRDELIGKDPSAISINFYIEQAKERYRNHIEKVII